MEVQILYEDKNLLVINKPAGLVVHTDGRTSEPTVIDWIKEKYPKNEKVGEPLKIVTGETIKRYGVVHRIDRETSGVLLIAKNQDAYDFLKKQFLKRDIEKTYHAIVYGDLRYDEGLINLPIGRHKNDFRRWSADKKIRGEAREALTYYKVLGRKKDYTLVEANPQTGRTHQLRVHFSAQGHPIVGDKLYAPGKKTIEGLDRLALHAYSIEFESPDKKIHKIIAPYPADFKEAIGIFR